MKKSLLIIGMVVCLMSAHGVAHALTFSFDQSQLIQLWQVYESPSSTSDYVSQVFIQGTNTSGYVSNPDGSVDFAGYMSDIAGNPYTPFAQMQIGVNFWGASGNTGYTGASTADLGVGDLTAYDKYAMSFKNTDDDAWYFNIFMNTGWTDPNWNESDNYYENGWTKVLPGQSTSLVIDLANVQNLNHVSGIGFNIGGDMGGGGAFDPSRGDQFSGIQVSPVPEPASMLLLGMGLFGLGGAARRKKVKA